MLMAAELVQIMIMIIIALSSLSNLAVLIF